MSFKCGMSCIKAMGKEEPSEEAISQEKYRSGRAALEKEEGDWREAVAQAGEDWRGEMAKKTLRLFVTL